MDATRSVLWAYFCTPNKESGRYSWNTVYNVPVSDAHQSFLKILILLHKRSNDLKMDQWKYEYEVNGSYHLVASSWAFITPYNRWFCILHRRCFKTFLFILAHMYFIYATNSILLERGYLEFFFVIRRKFLVWFRHDEFSGQGSTLMLCWRN